MDPQTFSCPSCKTYSTGSLNSLRIHAQKLHGLPAKSVYDSLFLPDGKEPTCECGCGGSVKFNTIQLGYSKYIKGHAARVNNNWGHNKVAQAHSLKTRRDEGLWSKVPWNKGKRASEDPVFAEIVKKAYQTPEFRAARSRDMTKNRLSKIVPDLSGSAHSQWKGGTSAIQPLARSCIHKSWTYPKLAASGFKCSRCSSTLNLEVHHSGERFASILGKAIQVFGPPGDNHDTKDAICEWVASYHEENDVPGVVLCELCHTHTHLT